MEGNQTSKDLSDMSTNPRTAVTDSQQRLPTARNEAWNRVTLGPQSAVLLLLTVPRAGTQRISAVEVTNLWNFLQHP